MEPLDRELPEGSQINPIAFEAMNLHMRTQRRNYRYAVLCRLRELASNAQHFEDIQLIDELLGERNLAAKVLREIKRCLSVMPTNPGCKEIVDYCQSRIKETLEVIE